MDYKNYTNAELSMMAMRAKVNGNISRYWGIRGELSKRAGAEYELSCARERNRFV